MTASTTLIQIGARYTRSVHLLRDYDEQGTGLAGYQATPLVIQTAERILAGLADDATARAFSMIGPYGSGKSAFGVFLAHLLRSDSTRRRQLLNTHSTSAVAEHASLYAPVLAPVLVNGNNSSLRIALLLALQEMLRTLHPLGQASQTLVEELTGAIEVPDLDPQRVADLTERTASIVKQATPFQGLVLIVDELGQFLDYAAHQKSERDLFVLQTLAEMAARSGPSPVLLLTILHQTFENYAPTAGQSQRLEWAKVQGRFISLPFQEPSGEMLRMIGRALCPDRQSLMQSARRTWAEKLAQPADQLALRPTAIPKEEWHDLVAQTYPVHPTVLVALPSLFRQLAQNERSLFAFLTTHEPSSLLDVIESSEPDAQIPTYRLTHLYAYIEATFGLSLFGMARGRRWAELAEARNRLHDPEPLVLDVLTAIGTIGALGQQRGLHANMALLSFALRDSFDDPVVAKAVDQLVGGSQIVYRKHRDSYVIWEGSDLDLESMIQAARQRIADQIGLVQLLQQHAAPLPLVARGHSYRSGAMRHFTVRFAEVATLERLDPRAKDADGELLAIVPTDDEALALGHRWAALPNRADEPWRIAIVPDGVQFLRDLLLDLAALRDVLNHAPELQYDTIARRELASQLREAEQALDGAITRTFGPGTSCWYWCGRQTPVPTARQRDALLSQACDTTYHLTPRVWNELINRRQLSSAAAKARRNLIEAMLDHAHEPTLGLQGYPPERAIYESVLRVSGVHRQESDGAWRFGPPMVDDARNLKPTWDHIQAFFDGSDTHSRSIIDLYDELAVPPFGVKEGLIPLLFVAGYLANAGELALYEHGSYVTVPDISTFERILRQPGYFAVRQSRASGVRVAVYERLARAMAPKALEKRGQVALLDAVTPLLQFVTRLTPYARGTRGISARAIRVRQALLEARAPDELIFEHLPVACEVAPFTADAEINDQHIEAFFTALRAGLQELQATYPTLVSTVRDQIRNAFGAQARESDAVHEELRARYHRIAVAASDTAIRALGVRLSTSGSGDAWVESVAALVGRKPLDTWQDGDVTQFAIQIADLGRRFRLFEQVAIVQHLLPAETTVLRVGIADARAERSIVVHAKTDGLANQTVQERILQSLVQLSGYPYGVR